MVDEVRQAQLQQRLQEMGVMQGTATTNRPDTTSSHSSGFSGLIPMMIIAIIVTGVFIYWLTLESSKHKNISQSTTPANATAGKQATGTTTEPAAQGSAPTHYHPPLWHPFESQIKTEAPNTTSVNSEADQATNESQAASSKPAGTSQGTPAYPVYPGPAYPYPPAPYAPYAAPPYPPPYMAPPGYPYPPAPWPPRR